MLSVGGGGGVVKFEIILIGYGKGPVVLDPSEWLEIEKNALFIKRGIIYKQFSEIKAKFVNIYLFDFAF